MAQLNGQLVHESGLWLQICDSFHCNIFWSIYFQLKTYLASIILMKSFLKNHLLSMVLSALHSSSFWNPSTTVLSYFHSSGLRPWTNPTEPGSAPKSVSFQCPSSYPPHSGTLTLITFSTQTFCNPTPSYRLTKWLHKLKQRSQSYVATISLTR